MTNRPRTAQARDRYERAARGQMLNLAQVQTASVAQSAVAAVGAASAELQETIADINARLDNADIP